MKKKVPTARTKIRCAIYGRKSTEEGLEQEFNSLDAQRDSGEAYIKSQAQEGWVCLPDIYEDGGFTGANMDRPALKRLLEDIEAGKVDCVVVYKVDRLSRSLFDFARLIEIFDRHKVSFVSVTQQFNTATSMGRLILNVLLSFAQFERDMISERTRDKMRAARRKGKYVGGTPILGYDVDREAKKLVVNRDEAERVKAIFQLYLKLGALLPVVQELERRGWTNKCWTTKSGEERGGKPFTKTSLHKFLTNVTYIGKAESQGEIFAGEQPAIVSWEIWDKVQRLLKQNSRNGGASAKNSGSALLKGLLHCSACDCAMSPTASSVRGGRRYRYYVCCGAQKRGWDKCPSKSIPAAEIEKFVVEQIRSIGQDPGLIRETIVAVQRQSKEQTALLAAEERILVRDLGKWHEKLRKLAGKAGSLAATADLQEQIGCAEQRLSQIQDQRIKVERGLIGDTEVRQALLAFSPVWETLTPKEQERLIGLVVERIDYDGGSGKIAVTFHETGIKTLAGEQGEAA